MPPWCQSGTGVADENAVARGLVAKLCHEGRLLDLVTATYLFAIGSLSHSALRTKS